MWQLTISPEELVPKLPAPRELQPFPTGEALCLRGHAACVRSVDFDPSGQYIVSGSDDHTVRGKHCLHTLSSCLTCSVLFSYWTIHILCYFVIKRKLNIHTSLNVLCLLSNLFAA